MNCKEVRAIIEDFRENALDRATKAMVREHLGECMACCELLGRLDSLDRDLKVAMSDLSPSPAFYPRLAEMLSGNEDVAVTGGHISRLRPVLAAAASVLLALFLWQTLSSTERVVPQDQSQAESTVMVQDDSIACEPSMDVSFAIGPAFAIENGRRTEYRPPTSIRIRRVVRGTPILVVEAFPEEE